MYDSPSKSATEILAEIIRTEEETSLSEIRKV
jgi:hypothetical protein